MRKFLIVSLLCLLVGIQFVDARDRDRDGDRDRKCHRVCRCKHIISSKQLNQGIPVVIDQPGVWCLDGDAEFNPSPAGVNPPDPAAVQAAISVAKGVSNVTINLGRFRLSQALSGKSSQVPYVIGILVPDPDPTQAPDFVGAQSIYIKGRNAIIDGFSMFGIRIFAHTSDIQISGLTVKNVGGLASAALRPFPSYFPHSISTNAAFGTNNAFHIAAIAIGETTFAGLGPTFFTQSTAPLNRVSSVILKNVSCLNNFYNGLLDACSTDVTIKNCHFDRTWSDQPVFTVGTPPTFIEATSRGAYFVGSNNSADGVGVINLKVSNTTFNDTTLRGNGVNTFDFLTPANLGNAIGTLIFDCQNSVWKNCQFNNSTNLFASTSSIAFNAGFEVGGMVDTTMINCSFDGTTALSSVQGFHLSGSGNAFAQETDRGSRNTLLINCTANNIQQIGDKLQPAPVATTGSQALGYLISFATDVVFENCVSSDVIVNGPMDTAGFAAGFRVAGATTRVDENKVFRGCVAQRCLARNGGQARGFSLVATNGTAGIIERSIVCEVCIAEGCIASPGTGVGQTSLGFGFYLEGDSNFTPNATSDFPNSFINCQALRNKGALSAVVTGLTQYSGGFYGLGAQRSTFEGCIALDNINGFFFQNSDRNTIRNCRADNNSDNAVVPTGAGFTDIGTGSPAVPTVSTSLFTSNEAFANGNGTSPIGPSGNYNVVLPSGPVPTLQGSLSAANPYPTPAAYSPLHNISMIK